MEEDEIMTAAQIVKELGLSRSAGYARIEKWMKQGKLTPLPDENPYREKRTLRFDKATAMKVLEASKKA